MEWIHGFFEIVKHLINPEWVIHHGGIYLLLVMIFAETGLFVGFFLPGDSLLFVSGMVASKTINPFHLNFAILVLLVSLAGVMGNFAGYWFGNRSGHLLFQRKDSFIFKKRHLTAAHQFYEKYGGSAIIFARFLPFIRTFAPIIAGAVDMNFKKFTLFNILGCVAWVFTMMVGGFTLGKFFPWLGDHLEILVLGIVLITTAPVLIKLLIKKKKKLTHSDITPPNP
ncbi:MAG: DedA family protein [Chitinophagaceae bacterium]